MNDADLAQEAGTDTPNNTLIRVDRSDQIVAKYRKDHRSGPKEHQT